MDKYIIMSQKELRYYDIIKKAINKELTATQAASLLNITTRHIRRLKRKVKKGGIKGLIHKNRGRRSNRKTPDEKREEIIALIKKSYPDFGPTLVAEKLEEVDKIQINKGTVRSIMIEEGIWQPKVKKTDKHRSWRQRRASYGEMLQYDGSYHHWFEDRGDKCCLLASIDDASNRIWLKFDKHEGVFPTFSFWREYIKRFGKPYSIYVDRFSTYSINHKLAKENSDTLTQFQRALEKDLNIEVIHAKSAEAKGRVEKLFKTLQDRLVKELRLNNINTIEEANRFLEEEYIDKYNARFMVEARSKANLHKQLSKQEENNLDSIFSRQYERVIRNDFTISHNKNYYQLIENQPMTVCKRDKVIIEEKADKTINIRLKGKYLNYELLPERPKKLNDYAKMWVIPKSKAHKPAPNHPWRQYQKTRTFNN
jgi:transposase